MSDKSTLVSKILYHPRHDVATEVFLLVHEAIRWDLEEIERHLKEPHFTGQPQKVHIFFRWFEGYFCELVRLSHTRTQRLLSFFDAPSGDRSSRVPSEGGEEGLGGAGSTHWEQHELWEREMRMAERIMQEAAGIKHSLLDAQADDRPNYAEELRQKVEELSMVLRRCMTVEEQGLVPWLRQTVEVEDARVALEAEMGGDIPAMGWVGLAMWLPWIIHGMERWCSPQDVADFREGLPWLIASLTQYMWEPLYISSNWALLQSMADPLEDDDTADLDDDL